MITCWNISAWRKRRQRIGTFSKGMRQKLALARALMHEPPVLLLDEPTSAMDPELARLVRDEIANLRSSQRAIVICTHNLAEAETLADIIVIIYRGRILMQGTLEELKDRVLGPVEFTARLSQAWDARGLELPEGVEMRTPAENQVRFQVERPRETNPRLMAALAAAQAPVLTFEEVSAEPRTGLSQGDGRGPGESPCGIICGRCGWWRAGSCAIRCVTGACFSRWWCSRSDSRSS